jgi:hypothetical protein
MENDYGVLKTLDGTVTICCVLNWELFTAMYLMMEILHLATYKNKYTQIMICVSEKASSSLEAL